MKRRGRCTRCALCCVLCATMLALLGSSLNAQWRYRMGFEGLDRLVGPDGDYAVTSKFTSLRDSLGRPITLGITSRAIYSTANFLNWRERWPSRGSKTLFNTSIVAGTYNRDSGSPLYNSYTALLGSGDVYNFRYADKYKYASEWNPVSFTNSYETGLRIGGDINYYVSSYQSMYITRDSGSTWHADMNGTNGGYPSGFALDKRGYAWLAASSGLYTQHPDSDSWGKVNSFPENSAYTIFHDRRNWTYVSTYTKVYFSTDFGTTWILHNAGLPNQAMWGFADDVFGNVYAFTGGTISSRIYRSSGGTSMWSRIDYPLTSQVYDSTHSQIINDLTGDTLIIASTIFGYFVSSDQGATWDLADCGLESHFLFGFDELPLGTRIMSTMLGIYTRGPSDTTWTKRFPLSGYLDRLPLYKDNSNYLYTQALRTDPSNYFSIPYTLRSTDFGFHWVLDDSTGSSLVKNGIQFMVDELGTQHYVSFGSPNEMFKKPFGLSWTLNSVGYTYRANEIPTFFGSDGHGYNYAGFARYVFETNGPARTGYIPASASEGILWRQPVSGGPWVADTAGLNENGIYALASDVSGNPIVGTYADGLYRRSGGLWSKIPSPPGLASSSAFAVSVDGSNAIFAGYGDLMGTNFVWRGIWFTTDLGVSWTYAGLDSVSIRALKSYGDTTFAVTLSDGVYRLTRSGVTTVSGQRTSPSGFALAQNYPNPFNPSTTIHFDVPRASQVNLKVYNTLGQEVATLVNESKAAGSYQVKFDATRFASGLYIYRLTAGSYLQSRKMLLLK